MSHGNFRQDQKVIPGDATRKPRVASLPPKGVSQQATQSPEVGTRTIFNVAANQVRYQTNSTTPQLIFQTESSRQYLLIQNRSTNSIFIAFGQKANENNGIEILAGGAFEPTIAPIDAVYLIGNQLGGSQVVIALQGLV